MKVTSIPLAAALAVGTLWAGGTDADAQVRIGGGVRVATPRSRVSVFVGRPYYFGRPYYYRSYYRPYYFDLFYGNYFYPPFYWYPYGQVGYGPYGYGDGASLRVQVTPRDTEVFIDNYYAGIADDFDGLFQRLHVEPGAHDITLYHDGYRTVRQRIYIQPTGTFRLRYMMMPLGPGEVAEPRPVGPPPPQNPPGPPSSAGPSRYPPLPPRGAPPQGAYPPPPGTYPPPGNAADSTSLSIRVQPGNAEVFIDGERWEGPGDERLTVRVAPGLHHIEVRHDGYRTYQTDVNARPGETSTVNISLSRQ